MRRENTGSPNSQLSKSIEISKERKLGCGLASYPVLWMATCLFQIAILEVDTSLK